MSINQSESQEALQPTGCEPLSCASLPQASTQGIHFQTESISHLLLHIAQRLNSTFEVDTLLDRLIQDAKSLIGAESGCAGLYTPQGMVCHRYFQGDHVLPLEYCWPPNHGLPGWLIVHKVPYLTNDTLSDQQIVQELCLQFGIRSALSTPILDAQGDLLGFFELHNKQDNTDFTPSDQETLLALSHLASIALCNALGFQNLHEANRLLHAEAAERQKALLHMAAIVESSDDAILGKDLQGIITSWNAAAEHMYGYTAQEIVGQPVTLLFMPDRQNEFMQIMARIQQGERIDHYQTIRVRKDGTSLNVSVTISPIKDSTGTVIGASAIARDITEHRQLESKFRQLFDSNLIGIFVSDFTGTFLDANNAFLDLLGYTRAELVVGAMKRDALTPPELHHLSQNALKAMQEVGSSDPYEKEYLHKSGKRIPVLVAVARIEQTETCIGFVLDISERKELDKRKDEFISMASHELKTPVTSLKGFLSLLERRLTTQGNQQELYFLTRINAQVNKLTKLINDLLDLSKMQTGQLAYREERFEMDALVQEIAENVQATTQTHHLQLEGQTQAEVFGDRDRIGQVLINLLNNAIKYSPEADTVLICVTKDQNKILVRVQDFGIGIAKEHQQKIFDRFYQVTDPEEKTYPGLGIGLYISCEIVKRHGGQMWVESKKGQGATFHFTLPLSA
jgi:PAS domain S-box-containing protein